ncbi:Gamma-tubulin complex component 3 [Hypsizygus marmoreus]|uniref:Spindle pole body component n=1 Tax=Hypsizygus marmoreus TaxID=39966 RepID=A0A369J4C6_HYPMA|nr:Gamma-tubulin complex component 3 [Hypsizygus marmoreus]
MNWLSALDLEMSEVEAIMDDLKRSITDLPSIAPRFFVPPLPDKPQNPIMDTIRLASAHKDRTSMLPILPPELNLLTLQREDEQLPRPRKAGYNLWTDAITRNIGNRSKALSWDRLRPSHPTKASSTGFLSEQDSLVFAAARYHVNIRLRDPSVEMVYVTQDKLLNALKMTVLGTSSVFHTWDASAERFVQAGLADGQRGFLLMDGKDEVISQSLISRFITIGTLLRRLEILLAALRTRSAQEGPTVHAYAHSLSTVITYLRQTLARGPPINDPPGIQSHTLSAIWTHYGIYEEILVALADMYGRDEAKSPQDYPPFDPAPVNLLSLIYSHLDTPLKRQSPRVINAIFAFILTNVSHEYLQQVSRSVGYSIDPRKTSPRGPGERSNQYTLDDEDEEDKEEDLFERLESLGDTFPEFFPPELLDILPAAQKSLILLQTAQPEHPLLKRTNVQGVVRWFWTEDEIEAAWNGVYPRTHIQEAEALPPSMMPAVASDTEAGEQEKADFSIFQLFNLEPGSNFGPSTAVGREQTITQSLQIFVDTFPTFLPPITPSLSHLTSLVLAQLVEHASTLSNALLTLFLSPSPSDSDNTLNFQAHLHLLRSYLLVTAPPFKSRLAAALFSDSEDPKNGHDKAHGMSVRSLRIKRHKKAGEQPWAVGLAPSLLERETWPPVGADLSFFLRTVIVDSIESGAGRDAQDGDGQGGKVLEEAEYRLGFAIRDLPVGQGRDKWLNPLSIEALDFLYMDYKPPHPLEVLITPEILSKYQRMFAFILRLMRVESALGALFRMTRSTSKPLFPTLVSARKHLLHFRFVAQSFVSTLSSYVFDTAIGGNFDPFIAQLTEGKKFTDVFALAKSHSALLDDILTACLLRSGQHAVGDLLRQAMELILDFVVVVGEMFRGRVEEYRAAPELQDVARKFFGKMATFTKVLKGLVDKNGLAVGVPLQGSQTGVEAMRKPTGGADALYHLLIRLDLGEWWVTSKR